MLGRKHHLGSNNHTFKTILFILQMNNMKGSKLDGRVEAPACVSSSFAENLSA